MHSHKNICFFTSLLFFILAFTGASAQDSRWQVGFTWSPEYDYRIIRSDDTMFSRLVVPFRNEFERPAFGFTTGFKIDYLLSAHWSFRSALLWNERTYAQRRATVAEQLGYFGHSIGNDPTPIVATQSKYAFGYLSLPLTAEYRFNLGKCELGVYSGLSLDYLLYVRTDWVNYYKDNTMHEASVSLRGVKTGANPFTANLLGGASIHIPFDDRTSLSAGPYTKWSTYSINNPRLRERLYSYGLELSIMYAL